MSRRLCMPQTPRATIFQFMSRYSRPRARRMKVYALTGGIAAGKSEVSRRFIELGVPVIDADRVAHSVIETGGAAEQGVLEAFGREILTCGKIDRQKLGALVFGDPEALQRLNALVHPAVGVEIAQRTARYAEDGSDIIIVEAALHAENGKLGPGLEALILVACPRETRMQRLTAQRGMTEEEARRRIDAQTPPEQKKVLARWVLENNGTLDQLRRQVDEIAKEL